RTVHVAPGFRVALRAPGMTERLRDSEAIYPTPRRVGPRAFRPALRLVSSKCAPEGARSRQVYPTGLSTHLHCPHLLQGGRRYQRLNDAGDAVEREGFEAGDSGELSFGERKETEGSSLEVWLEAARRPGTETGR